MFSGISKRFFQTVGFVGLVVIIAPSNSSAIENTVAFQLIMSTSGQLQPIEGSPLEQLFFAVSRKPVTN